MNREEIIRMARDSGIVFDEQAFPYYGRFAALVAAAATEEANRRANAGWTHMCEKMVAAEREACAKECEGVEGKPEYLSVAKLCAAAIRARGQA